MWHTPLLLSGSLWPSWLVGAGQGAFSPFSHQQLSIMIAAVRGSPIEIVIAIFSLDSEGWWLWFTAKQRRLRRETPANPFFSPNYPQKVQHHHRNGLAHQSRVWTFGRMAAILFKRSKNYPSPLTRNPLPLLVALYMLINAETHTISETMIFNFTLKVNCVSPAVLMAAFIKWHNLVQAGQAVTDWKQNCWIIHKDLGR